MDKLMENNWFLKGISLLLACMLFMSATLTEKNTTSSILPFVNESKETLTDYPITLKYDEEKVYCKWYSIRWSQGEVRRSKSSGCYSKSKKPI